MGISIAEMGIDINEVLREKAGPIPFFNERALAVAVMAKANLDSEKNYFIREALARCYASYEAFLDENQYRETKTSYRDAAGILGDVLKLKTAVEKKLGDTAWTKLCTTEPMLKAMIEYAAAIISVDPKKYL